MNLKTPISYYGGKQSTLREILPMIPEHRVYVEPFFGGGAVFFGKAPAKSEIINDFNGMVVNFYEQLRSNFNELKNAVEATPYSRQMYQKAIVVYECPYIFSPLVRAWAFWVVTVQGFNNQIGSWRATCAIGKKPRLFDNRKADITPEICERLKNTQIECNDAVYLIERLDSADTFFYIDPPYVGAHQGHYGGYTQKHFNTLLEVLAKVEGKFLLSSYPNEKLTEYREQFGWQNHDQNLMSSTTHNKRRKIECLTFNYKI